MKLIYGLPVGVDNIRLSDESSYVEALGLKALDGLIDQAVLALL
jgi:hypothetical protein